MGVTLNRHQLVATVGCGGQSVACALLFETEAQLWASICSRMQRFKIEPLFFSLFMHENGAC